MWKNQDDQLLLSPWKKNLFYKIALFLEATSLIVIVELTVKDRDTLESLFIRDTISIGQPKFLGTLSWEKSTTKTRMDLSSLIFEKEWKKVYVRETKRERERERE